METKKYCGGCDKTKLTSDFNKSKRNKDGLQIQCRKCCNEKILLWNKTDSGKASIKKCHLKNKEQVKINVKRHYESYKDGNVYVYLLPEVNYVGITQNIKWRMSHHQHYNNITSQDKYEILATCDTRERALWIEKIWHGAGYLGAGNKMNKQLLTNKTKVQCPQ